MESEKMDALPSEPLISSKFPNFNLIPDKLFLEVEDAVSELKKLAPPIQISEDVKSEEAAPPEAPFVKAAIAESQRSRTENDGPTFNTSGDPRVDFFFHVMEQTSPELTCDLLKKAWERDSLDTLKLIGSLRDIKDGKGIRQQYQHCLYWLYVNHPITLYNNLPHLLKLGYWKDALEMLMIVLFDGFVHPYFAYDDGNGAPRPPPFHYPVLNERKRRLRRYIRQTDSEKRIYNVKIAKHFKILSPDSDNVEKIKKKELDAARLSYAREFFANSTKYRLFHTRIAKIFAEQLAKDIKVFEGGDKKNEVSLAAKWAPSLKGHFDRYSLISTTIALELCHLLKTDFLSKSIPTATYLARKFYHKKVCVPLRAHLEIPEVSMSRSDWGTLNYKRIPARCMVKNKAHFIKHDRERFTAFLTKDTNKVAGATLKPIQIIRTAMSISLQTEEAEKLIMEKQWSSLVEDIKKKGSLLAGAIAICDVSASMKGDPMTAALGLTLLTMEQTMPPWNEICITFHTSPSLFHIDPKMSLLQKVTSLRSMPWGGTTNFQATLRLILNLGIENKLPKEDMPKILFVFTDMEFNQAFLGSQETNIEVAKREFGEHGYELPALVFWNLRADTSRTSTPVQKNENGAILLSGFSGQLLSFVMNQKNLVDCSPWNFVKTIIDHNKYKELEVYD